MVIHLFRTKSIALAQSRLNILYTKREQTDWTYKVYASYSPKMDNERQSTFFAIEMRVIGWSARFDSIHPASPISFFHSNGKYGWLIFGGALYTKEERSPVMMGCLSRGMRWNCVASYTIKSGYITLPNDFVIEWHWLFIHPTCPDDHTQPAELSGSCCMVFVLVWIWHIWYTNHCTCASQARWARQGMASCLRYNKTKCHHRHSSNRPFEREAPVALIWGSSRSWHHCADVLMAKKVNKNQSTSLGLPL